MTSNTTRVAALSPSNCSTRRRALTAGAIAWAHSRHLGLVRHSFQAAEFRSAGAANSPARAEAASPRRAIVMHFSTSGRTSLAFCSVVTIRPGTFGGLGSSSASRSVRNRLLARLRSMARRWLELRPR